MLSKYSQLPGLRFAQVRYATAILQLRGALHCNRTKLSELHDCRFQLFYSIYIVVVIARVRAPLTKGRDYANWRILRQKYVDISRNLLPSKDGL